MRKLLPDESARNLILPKRMVEDIPTMASNTLKMPFSKRRCDGCGRCSSCCPANAIDTSDGWSIDIGKCIFCMTCIRSCECKAIDLVDAPLYVSNRTDLIFRRDRPTEREATPIDENKRRVIGRSVSIREVDTGSCNACEVEVNSMFNSFFDADRFGIKIVASPRHADVLLITGPLTENMYGAFIDVVASTPDPKILVAMGTCAISGGIFSKGSVVDIDIRNDIPMDIYIPGCPPSPNRLILSLISAFKL